LKQIDQTGFEYSGGPSLFSGPAFSAILDETCERLEESRNRGALKRIRKMEEVLETIENELDALLRGADSGIKNQ
jgi:hypothetical protein